MPENRGPSWRGVSHVVWQGTAHSRHIATRPVAVTSAVLLPATMSSSALPATYQGGPPMTGRLVLSQPPSRLAAAAAAFLVQPTLAWSTRCSMTRSSLGWYTSSAAIVRSRRSTLQCPPPGRRPRHQQKARSGPTAWPLHSPEAATRASVPRDQRARREVELASVRDCYDDPHRRSLMVAPTPRPASLP
jgi:hypothetical protein